MQILVGKNVGNWSAGGRRIAGGSEKVLGKKTARSVSCQSWGWGERLSGTKRLALKQGRDVFYVDGRKVGR